MVEKNGDALKTLERRPNGVFVSRPDAVDAELRKLFDLQKERIKNEPYFPVGGELEVMRAAYYANLPIILKGPTGIAKSTLVANFAVMMGLPMEKVPGEQNISTSNSIGSVIPLEVEGMGVTMVYKDGPVANFARSEKGALLYITEANKIEGGMLSAFHTITDYDRMLYILVTGEHIPLSPKSAVITDYNPLYKGGLENLSPAFLQRFVHITLEMPEQKKEQAIFEMKYGLRDRPGAPELGKRAPRKADKALIDALTKVAKDIRMGKDKNFDIIESPSPRLVDNAIKLVEQGLSPYYAVMHGLIQPLVDTLNGSYHAMLKVVDGFSTLLEGKP